MDSELYDFYLSTSDHLPYIVAINLSNEIFTKSITEDISINSHLSITEKLIDISSNITLNQPKNIPQIQSQNQSRYKSIESKQTETKIWTQIK